MYGAQYCTVAWFFAQNRKCRIKIFFFNLTQYIFSKMCCNLLHFYGNLCIFVCQSCMRPFRIHNTQCQSCFFKIRINFFYLRFFFIFKININHAADGTCHLVHQSAWLAKIHIFRISAGLCNGYCRNFRMIVQSRYNRANQCFKCCRWRQSRTGKHITCNICAKSTHFISLLFQACKHAANQSFSCSLLARFLIQFVQPNFTQLVSFWLYPHQRLIHPACNCNGIQTYRCRKHSAMLVVCMIAAHFTSARCTIDFNRHFAKNFTIRCHCFYITFFLLLYLLVIHIKLF